MAVSKRLRFEVFRRDNHTCRYCGRSAPDVPLRPDHVTPVALGGSDDPSNLVTACQDCNSGKSSVPADAPLIANVQDDAFRWSRAIAAAADSMLTDTRARRDDQDAFLSRWEIETERLRLPKGYEPPLDPGWRVSVNQVIAAGLPIQVLLECIDIAVCAENVKSPHKFRYAFGVAWRKIDQLQEAARSSLGAEIPPGEAGASPVVELCADLLGHLDDSERDRAAAAGVERANDHNGQYEHALRWAFEELRTDREALAFMIHRLLGALPDDVGEAALKAARAVAMNEVEAHGIAVAKVANLLPRFLGEVATN